MTKIKKKITAYKVVDKNAEELPIAANELPEMMHEGLSRPEILKGSSYKIKTPQSEHALYVTINDMVLNAGTDNEELHPYEIFVNSKNMENFPKKSKILEMFPKFSKNIKNFPKCSILLGCFLVSPWLSLVLSWFYLVCPWFF